MPRGRKRFPWIKLWFDMLNDVKMNRLSIAERGCWVSILLLAGQSPERGKLLLTESEPMTMDDIASALHLTPGESPVLESCISKLVVLKSLAWNSHCLEVVNFKKRQEVYESDLTEGELPKLRINSELTPTDDRRKRIDDRRKKKDSSPNGEEIHMRAEKQDTLKLFDVFWQAYPRKRSKGRAEKSFDSVIKGTEKHGSEAVEQLMTKILSSLERNSKSREWLKDNGQYIPHPATWLNARGWEDEFEEDRKGGVNGESSKQGARPHGADRRYTKAPSDEQYRRGIPSRSREPSE